MRIVKTHLVQICQHRDRVVKFKPGLIGLFGANGVGKSNLLKMGAYANLTNDFTRNKKPKLKNIRYLAGPEDPAYIETEWEHDSHKFTIRRGLQKPKRDTLSSPELETPLHKEAEIDDWLVKLTGLENFKYLADNYMFIGQGELTAFLDEEPTARAKGYANLCGTTIAESCWDELGKRITKDAPLTVEVLDNSDQLNKEIGEQAEIYRVSQKRLKKYQAMILADDERDRLHQLLTASKRRKELLAAQTTQRDKFVEDKAAHLAAVETLAKTKKRWRKAVKAATGAKSELVQVTAKLQTLKSRKAAADNKARLTAELAELKPPAKPQVEMPQQSAMELRSGWLAVNKDRLEKIRKVLKNVDKKGTVECSHCGTTVTDMKKHIDEMKAELAKLPTEIEKRQAEYDAWGEALADWQAYDRKVDRQRVRREEIEKQLATMADVVPVEAGEQAELTQQKEHLEQLLETAEDRKNRHESARASERDARRDRLDSVRELKKIVTELATLVVDKAGVKAAKAKLHENAVAVARRAKYRERSKNAEKKKQEKETELTTLRKRIAETARMREWLTLLQSMRDVLVRTNLPRIVHESYQQMLLPDANALLAKFRSPFTLSAGPGLSFVAEKPDGTIETAECLSGGEQVVTALAIRWAVHSLSACGLGMLVLDEPTAGLDEANLRYLEEALPQLGAEARSRGLQVIVVTHESSLESVFDQVIELT